MKKNYQKVIDFLKIITKPWGEKIKYGIELNLPIGVEIAQTDYEALSCLIYDLKGTGKTSGDNDHNNGDETKGANKIKPKECKCGKICHWFSKKCECGSSEFLYGDNENRTDIRWGIDTIAHFKYINFIIINNKHKKIKKRISILFIYQTIKLSNQSTIAQLFIYSYILFIFKFINTNAIL
jgi:hypothetical protein